jgi:hypothetical protein
VLPEDKGVSNYMKAYLREFSNVDYMLLSEDLPGGELHCINIWLGKHLYKMVTK